jgi:hypothetical protein
MKIRTIKDLKELIQDLPDDVEVMCYNGGNGGLWPISWIVSKDTLTEEELLGCYPNGLIPKLVLQ